MRTRHKNNRESYRSALLGSARPIIGKSLAVIGLNGKYIRQKARGRAQMKLALGCVRHNYISTIIDHSQLM